MVAAIQRLLLISVGVLCLTFLAVVFARWAGEQQGFAEPPHPWFTFEAWTVAKPAVCEGDLKAEATQLIWLPVYFKNDAWNVKCPAELALKDVLAKSPHAQWLLYVDSKDTVRLDALIKDLEPFDKNKSFGVVTPSQTVARYLRKKAPQWVYGADPATLLRLHMFTSFWLETAFDFWPDFVVQVPGDKITQLNERELNELRRRKKRVIQVEFTP